MLWNKASYGTLVVTFKFFPSKGQYCMAFNHIERSHWNFFFFFFFFDLMGGRGKVALKHTCMKGASPHLSLVL